MQTTSGVAFVLYMYVLHVEVSYFFLSCSQTGEMWVNLAANHLAVS